MNLIVFLCATFVLAVVLEPLLARMRVPWTAGLVVLGFVASELITGPGGDIGLRWQAVQEIVFFVLLPILVFEAALNLDAVRLRQNLVPILALAIPLMLVSVAVIAAVLRVGIGPAFPWIAALFTGAILSATDPVGVLAMFKRMNAPRRLTVLVDGESLFNDATAIVIASLLLGFAAGGREAASVSVGLLEFLRVFFGGLLAGALVGGTLLAAFRVISDPVAQVGLTIAGAFLAFAVSEGLLHVSGVMAVLAAGLLGAGGLQRRPPVLRLAHETWEVLAYVANGVVFLLMGATITLAMFTERWLAMVIGIGAALVARAIVVFGGIPVLNRLPGAEPLSTGYQTVLFWGGLRGAVTVALALSIPLEYPWWYTAQAIAYGVVLFTLLVQAPSMPTLLRRLEI